MDLTNKEFAPHELRPSKVFFPCDDVDIPDPGVPLLKVQLLERSHCVCLLSSEVWEIRAV